RLVFLSYQDGWPDLYSVPAGGGPPLLLMPGPFMVEHITVSADRRLIVYGANSGIDPNDIDRRHLFRVPVDAAAPSALTGGRGIEWNPAVTADGTFVAYLTSDAQRPPLPAVQPIGGRTAI